MMYSKIHIDPWRYQEIISKNLKISADPARPAKIRQNRDPTRPHPTRPHPTRGFIRPVDNSGEGYPHDGRPRVNNRADIYYAVNHS